MAKVDSNQSTVEVMKNGD